MLPVLVRRPVPDAFCEVALEYEVGGERHRITDVYVGPEELSSAAPTLAWSYDAELYEGPFITLVLRTWTRREGDPDVDPHRSYSVLRVFESRDGGRCWSLLVDRGLGRYVVAR